MAKLTKKQQQELFSAEFARRLRAAPPGMRVFMRVGDLFQKADVIELEKWRVARSATAAHNTDTEEEN